MKINPTTSTTAKTNRLIPFTLDGRDCDLNGGISMVATMVAVTARPINIHQLKSALASASLSLRASEGTP